MQTGFKRGTWISKPISKLGQKARTELIEGDTAGLQSSLGSKEPSPHLLQRHSFLESTVPSTEELWKTKIVTESVPHPGSGRSRKKKTTVFNSRSPQSSGGGGTWPVLCWRWSLHAVECRPSWLTEICFRHENLLKQTEICFAELNQSLGWYWSSPLSSLP